MINFYTFMIKISISKFKSSKYNEDNDRKGALGNG